MLPTKLLTAALFLFTSVSALEQSTDEDAEARKPRGPKKTPSRARTQDGLERNDRDIKGQCVANAGNGICVVVDGGKVKKIPCGGGSRKCTGATRRPCTWHPGFASCT
jgi:hypothetical protein